MHLSIYYSMAAEYNIHPLMHVCPIIPTCMHYIPNLHICMYCMNYKHDQVRMVKRYKNGFITDPTCLSPTHTIADLDQ